MTPATSQLDLFAGPEIKRETPAEPASKRAKAKRGQKGTITCLDCGRTQWPAERAASECATKKCAVYVQYVSGAIDERTGQHFRWHDYMGEKEAIEKPE